MNELPIEKTLTGMFVTFCKCNGKRCPSIDIDKDRDTVVIGGKEEGFTNFTKEQFEMFVEQAKMGTFDRYL